jgi:L-cystine transport system permease protein
MEFFAQAWQALPILLSVYPTTLLIVLLSAVVGLPIAVGLAAIRVTRVPVLSWLTGVLISYVRSNPAVLNLMLIYYGLPLALQQIGIDITGAPKMFFAVAMLALYHACSITEVLRVGYLSVEREQKAAALSVGMTEFQAFRRISVPQVFAVVLPAYVNSLIDILGDTSVLFIIGMIDIVSRSKILISNTYGVNQLPVYLTLAVIYLATVVVMTRAMRPLERRMQRQGGDALHAV